jgi:hypothetical protein
LTNFYFLLSYQVNMNIKIPTLFVVGIFIFTCTGIKKDTSNDPSNLLLRFLFRRSLTSAINSNLPTSFSVAVPRSIRKSSSGGVSASLRANKKDLADDIISKGITGLSILQDSTTTVAQILQESKRDLVLISSIYNTAKASPGTCLAGGTGSVEITQDSVNEMVAGLTSLGLSETEALAELQTLQTAGTLPTVGQTIPTPAMVYRPPTDKNYDNEISLSFADSLTTAQNCPTNPIAANFQKTIRWNDSKTRVYSAIQKSLRVFSTTITIEASITYISEAGKKDKAIFSITQKSKVGRGAETSASSKFIMQECASDTTANTNNCMTLSLTSTEEKGSVKVKTTIKGRTDDLGGYVKTDYNDPTPDPITTLKIDYSIEEYYGSDNNILWLSITNNDPNNPGTYFEGTKDTTLIGAYDTSNGNFDFDSSLALTIILSGSGIGENSATGSLVSLYAEEDYFVLVPDGQNPNTSEDFILGIGEYVDSDSGTTPLSSDVTIVYYGTAEDVPTLKIWRETYDANGDLLYVLVTGDTVQAL